MPDQNTPKKSISEIATALKAVVPILQSTLRGQDASTATVQIDQAIAPVRTSVYDDYSPPIRTAFDQVTGSMNNWLTQASKAKPADRRAYAAGLDALERKIETFETQAQITLRDEERRNKVTS